MFSFGVLLALFHISLSEFIPGQSICYTVTGVQNKIFHVTYKRMANFLPEKLSMNILAVSKHPTIEKVYKQEVNYTITKIDGDCSDGRLDAIALTNSPGYTSHLFIAFYYGEYLVEHFKLKLGSLGQAIVEGVMERASLKIIAKVQESLDIPRSQADLSFEKVGGLTDNKGYKLTFMNLAITRPTLIKPVADTGIELPKIAIIKITLVDTNGRAIETFPPIVDLVMIEIREISTEYSMCYYTTDFKLHDVDIKILAVDGKEIGHSRYSLAHPSNKFEENFKPQSTFKLLGFEIEEIIENAETYPHDILNEYFRFITTISTFKECNINDKKAYVVEHTLKQHSLYKESLCVTKTKEIPAISFLTGCDGREIYKCLKGRTS